MSGPAATAIGAALRATTSRSSLPRLLIALPDRGHVRAEGLPGLTAFADSLTSDLDAVTPGLTTRWNSDPSRVA